MLRLYVPMQLYYCRAQNVVKIERITAELTAASFIAIFHAATKTEKNNLSINRLGQARRTVTLNLWNYSDVHVQNIRDFQFWRTSVTPNLKKRNYSDSHFLKQQSYSGCQLSKP